MLCIFSIKIFKGILKEIGLDGQRNLISFINISCSAREIKMKILQLSLW